MHQVNMRPQQSEVFWFPQDFIPKRLELWKVSTRFYKLRLLKPHNSFITGMHWTRTPEVWLVSPVRMIKQPEASVLLSCLLTKVLCRDHDQTQENKKSCLFSRSQTNFLVIHMKRTFCKNAFCLLKNISLPVKSTLLL